MVKVGMKHGHHNCGTAVFWLQVPFNVLGYLNDNIPAFVGDNFPCHSVQVCNSSCHIQLSKIHNQHDQQPLHQ